MTDTNYINLIRSLLPGADRFIVEFYVVVGFFSTSLLPVSILVTDLWLADYQSNYGSNGFTSLKKNSAPASKPCY